MFLRQIAKEVLQIRYWQHIINERLKKGAFGIPIHLAFGHEAIAVAVSNAMKEGDQLVSAHRNIAYNLARAGALKPVYDEYKLLDTGVAGGRLGSMNLSNPSKGVVYASSILGNNLPVACGVALGRKVLQSNNVTIVLTGDGAMEEGTFYEALVFSKSQALKLLIIVENNNHSLASTIKERRCPIALNDLCNSLQIPFRGITGNDVFKYHSQVEELMDVMRTGSIPACIEVDLAMFNQHAGPTPGWPTDPMLISIENGLVVENSDRDPLFVLKENIPSAVYAELADQILSQDWSEWK